MGNTIRNKWWGRRIWRVKVIRSHYDAEYYPQWKLSWWPFWKTLRHKEGRNRDIDYFDSVEAAREYIRNVCDSRRCD